MSIQVIDVSEQENDGAFGMFTITLYDPDAQGPVTAIAWYSLAEDRAMVSEGKLTAAQRAAIENSKDPETGLSAQQEMREAVMAERDARMDALKETKEAEAVSERKTAFVQRQETAKLNTAKWLVN